MDMPWFVQPDHPAVMVYPAPDARMAVEQERLYALGIDAYRLCGLLLQSDAKAVDARRRDRAHRPRRRPALRAHPRPRGLRRRPRDPAARRAVTSARTAPAAPAAASEAEERAARFLARAGPRDRGAQLPHPLGRDRPRRARRRDARLRRGAHALAARAYGGAAGSVDARKQRRIVAAARHYLVRLRRGTARAASMSLRSRDRRATPAWIRGAFDAA